MADREEMASSALEELRQSFVEFRQDNSCSDLVLVAAHRCVDGGLLKDMTDALLNPDNKDVLEFVGWELIGLLSKLNGELSEEHNIHLLDAIAEVCSPKEVCLGVVEQMDTGLSTQVFVTLLSPLQKAFSKLKGRKSKFLKMIIPMISRHVRMIQFPDNEDEDNTVNRCDTNIELSSVLDKVVELIQFVVYDTTGLETSEKTVSDEKESQTWELMKCLIGLLEILALENLTSKSTEETKETDDVTCKKSYRDHAIHILNLLCSLHCSAINLMEYASQHSSSFVNKHNTSLPNSDTGNTQNQDEEEPSDDENDKEVLPLLGVGCFSYLLFVEQLDAGHIPQVLRFDYLLKINLECVSCLLQRTNVQINYKGIELLSSLIEKIEDGSLEHYFLKHPPFLEIPKALINIMVYSTPRNLRKQATALLQQLIAKLVTRGRYILLRYLLLDCTHAGVAALLIHGIKEEVHSNLNSQNQDNWFRGKQLISLLRQVYNLPRGVGTQVDLVPETERVMAALNCFRYILLRDREDKTTLWKNYSMFEKDFLDPLRESLKVTRIRYLAVQKQNEDETKGADKRLGNSEHKIDFTVTTPDGTPINGMPLDDQIQVVRSGLYALDMMDCIIAHIAEIVTTRS